MIEVDAGDGVNVRVIESMCAINSGVVADMRAAPVAGEVVGVGGNGVFEGL